MLLDLIVDAYNSIEAHPYYSLGVFSVIIAAYSLFIYPFYLSPFKNIPGPYLFRISVLPSLHYQRTNKWVLKVHELHEIYGDVVLLSPKEISVNGDLKYLNDIYTKNFPKSTFYQNFANHGKPNMFASMSNDIHLKYKKNLQSIYSKSAIFNPKNSTRISLVTNIRKLLKNIEDSSVEGTAPDFINAASEVNIHGKGYHEKDKKWFLGGKTKNLPIEVYSLFGSLALDVVSQFELGLKNGTNLLENPQQREIVTYHRYVASMVFYTTLLPSLWDYAATKLILKSAQIVHDWQLGLYAKAELNIPSFKEDENLTTLETLRKHGFLKEAAYSFLSDNIFAGHETTAIQLTYITYELSRPHNQYLQKRLYDELHEAFSDAELIEDLEIVDKLPVLNAVLLEASRVHTSIPGAEPRVVDKVYKIKDTVIPKGTIISGQPYSYHRVPSVFPEPDVFKPERWLQQDDETTEAFEARTKKMHKYMIPFGKGIRMCLGMNVAQIEMKLAVANIYHKYHSKISSQWCDIVDKPEIVKMGDKYVGENKTDVEKMTMFDTYTTRPYNDECWLEFYRY
ncbi:putative cytochrome P450 monooxygenase Fgm1p [[Candida] jaroonii]|uniref:Cytochrome P450 monooxygenase Fgm1p n=1 Tax=[Candida] jaroonii TaxID=467808 RepID=A0ACA9YBI6_9ASCO|nr:putative cytochrome P450 monooxygenase Fgm1p [[Candida] jaroonii]